MGSSSGSPDGHLLRRARRGDREAFDLLAARHERALAAYLAARAGGPGEAADLLQEVYLRLLSSRGAGPPRQQANLRPYLLRVAMSVVVDRHRRARVRPASALTREVLEVLPAPGPGPLEAAAQEEREASLLGALDRLSDVEAEVVRLHAYGGLSLREVARVMGTPDGTAMARMRRALAKLRQALVPVGGCHAP